MFNPMGKWMLAFWVGYKIDSYWKFGLKNNTIHMGVILSSLSCGVCSFRRGMHVRLEAWRSCLNRHCSTRHSWRRSKGALRWGFCAPSLIRRTGRTWWVLFRCCVGRKRWGSRWGHGTPKSWQTGLVDWAACKWGCESVRFVITLECHFLLALWCFCSILCPVVQSVCHKDCTVLLSHVNWKANCRQQNLFCFY